MLTDEEKGGKMKAQRNFKLLFSCNGLAGKSQSFETGALRDGILPEKQKKRFAWCVVPLTLLVCMGIVAMTAAVAAAGRTPEEEMSKTVDKVCPQLPKDLSAQNPVGDLNLRCGELITPGLSGDFSALESDQKNGLSNMTSDETDTMGAVSVDISYAQFAAVTGRLAYLRGVGGGGLALNINNEKADPILFAGPVTAAAGGNESQALELGVLGGRLGLFLNGSYATGDKDDTRLEPGFDIDSWEVIGGADYRFTNNLFLGLALGYSWTDVDIDNDAGDVDVDGLAVSVYGTYYIDNFYFDAIGTYAKKDYSINRKLKYTVNGTTVNQKFKADPGSDEFSFSVGGGYDFNYKKFTFGPYVRADYLDIEIDQYTEALSNNNTNPGFGLPLKVEQQNIESLTSSLGGKVSYVFRTGPSVLTPYLSAEWVHEFDNDSRNIKASFINAPAGTNGNTIIIPTDDPDRDFANFGLGLSAVFPHGIMAFVDWQTILGLSDVTLNQITSGLRFEF